MQGALEVKAITHKVSSLLRIPKVSEEGTSHPILRTGLSFWNYLICGPLHTLPYLWIGLKIINSHLDDSDIFLHILLLVPFLLSDMCTNGMLFDESSNDIVSGVDSALSYKYASAGYKRDKLIRMTREMRRLFKEIDPEILLEVDEKLSSRESTHSYDNINSDDTPL